MIEIPDQAYKELSESAERYKSLVKTSPDAVTVTNLEGKVTEVSKQTLGLHGFIRESELVGKSALELIAPEDHEKALANLQKTLNEGSVKNLEYILLRKDGSRFIGELNASLIRDSSGKPNAFIATTRDVTWRKRAENDLRASEFMYRTLAESAQDFIFIIDVERRVKYVNYFAANHFGQPPEKVMGRKLDELLPSDVIERAKWNLKRVFDSGEAFTFEARIHLFGEDRWLDARLVPLKDESGKVKSLLGIARDMTKYKKSESELIEKMQELKEFNDEAVGRELKLIEMEKEIGRLKRDLPIKQKENS